MKIRIYALRTPISKEYFYVGQTSKSLRDRLNEHVCSAKKRPSCAVHKYMISCTLRPTIHLLEEVDASKTLDPKARTREDFWINKLRAEGIVLYNKVAAIKDYTPLRIDVKEDDLMVLRNKAKYLKNMLREKLPHISYNTIFYMIRRGRTRNIFFYRQLMEVVAALRSMDYVDTKFNYRIPMVTLTQQELEYLRINKDALGETTRRKVLRTGVARRDLVESMRRKMSP